MGINYFEDEEPRGLRNLPLAEFESGSGLYFCELAEGFLCPKYVASGLE